MIQRDTDYTNNYLSGHFSRKDKQIPSKYMKRCPTLLVIRELKIKVMSYFTNSKRARIQKKVKCW